MQQVLHYPAQNAHRTVSHSCTPAAQSSPVCTVELWRSQHQQLHTHDILMRNELARAATPQNVLLQAARLITCVACPC